MGKLVCIYCGEDKGERIGCCGENHFDEAESTDEQEGVGQGETAEGAAPFVSQGEHNGGAYDMNSPVAPLEPVATLHDDGCWTWKDRSKAAYESRFAGWRMEVYAIPPGYCVVPREPTEAMVNEGIVAFLKTWPACNKWLGDIFMPPEPIEEAFRAMLAAAKGEKNDN